MLKKYLKRFNEWWENEEPFGYDSPDTYEAVKQLLIDMSKEYEAEIEIGHKDISNIGDII